jgi:gluconolactonase
MKILVSLSLLFLVACATKLLVKDKKTAGDALTVVKSDAGLDAIVPPAATFEKLVGDFDFTEGPVWMGDHLLFSDIPRNVIYKWAPGAAVAEFLKPSGYDGTDAPAGAFICSNGLTLDKEKRLIITQHGNGKVVRRGADGKLTVLADKYEGKRVNLPNGAVYKSDGSLYFTDPPYGFPKQDNNPKKELEFNGIYRLSGSSLKLLYKDLARPNGIAFSPDEKFAYVANSDPARKIWMKFEVDAKGDFLNGQVFHDATAAAGDGLPDGLKVDKAGNLYGTGPGGVWVFDSTGKLLGKLVFLRERSRGTPGRRGGHCISLDREEGAARPSGRTSVEVQTAGSGRMGERRWTC